MRVLEQVELVRLTWQNEGCDKLIVVVYPIHNFTVEDGLPPFADRILETRVVRVFAVRS